MEILTKTIRHNMQAENKNAAAGPKKTPFANDRFGIPQKGAKWSGKTFGFSERR